MGAVIMLGYFVYAVLTLVLMGVGAFIAKRIGKPAWQGSLAVFLMSFLFVFWDAVPTLATHKYLCVTDYGFREFKSLEQWKAENPGVAETLVVIEKDNYEKRGKIEVMHLNKRFDWQRETESILLSVQRVTERIVDSATGDVLAEYVDIESGQSVAHPKAGFLAFRFWLYRPACHPNRPLPERGAFSELWTSVMRIGE